MITNSIVNAFSDSISSGNPAAVYIVDAFPSSDEMQKIAIKNNLSETAFLKNINNNQYQIRWFTPNSEAPICIHATLASAHCLYEKNIVNDDDSIEFLNLNNKFVASKTFSWINLNVPSIEIRIIKPNKLINEILKNCNVEYLGLSENILFVELKDKNEVKNFIPNLNLILKLPYRALLITSKDDEYDFISRYFAPSVGIDEDPVCGSAHCRLIPYWSKKLDKDSMMAYQASKRGGVIKCQNLTDKVIISGKTITVS
jgi:predicted PhzF superfamily epimerase YddE/YHI9